MTRITRSNPTGAPRSEQLERPGDESEPLLSDSVKRRSRAKKGSLGESRSQARSSSSSSTHDNDMDVESDEEPHRMHAEQLAIDGPWKLKDAEAIARRQQFRWWQRGYLKYYNFKDIPRYMQDNPDIHTRYRAGYTYGENWVSCIHLHNETFNIWTHYVGTILFTSLAAQFVLTGRIWSPVFGNVEVSKEEDVWVVALYCLLSAFTFITSGVYHMHLSHSLEAYVWYGCWDYSGISASVLASTASVHYYLFHCAQQIRTVWLVIVCLLNSLGLIGPAFKFWPTAAFRPYRVVLYIGCAIISMVPFVHHVLRSDEEGGGFNHLPGFNVWSGFLLMGVVYFIGTTIFYAGRFPERYWPGKFDLFFASHQIWHTLCVVAAMIQLHVVFGLIEWREQDVCPSSRG